MINPDDPPPEEEVADFGQLMTEILSRKGKNKFFFPKITLTPAGVWDFLCIMALLFTAFVTPVEVALLTPDPFSTLWLINRFVDFLFITDMIMSFFRPYLDPTGVRITRQPYIFKVSRSATVRLPNHPLLSPRTTSTAGSPSTFSRPSPLSWSASC